MYNIIKTVHILMYMYMKREETLVRVYVPHTYIPVVHVSSTEIPLVGTSILIRILCLSSITTRNIVYMVTIILPFTVTY